MGARLFSQGKRGEAAVKLLRRGRPGLYVIRLTVLRAALWRADLSAPSVFISYSYDSDAHKAWVKRLAEELKARDIKVTLDQNDLRFGQDMAMFMQQGIANADRVLLICSDRYVEKANSGVGGVGYERLIVTAEVVGTIDTIKFIPVMRGCREPGILKFLGVRRFADFRSDDAYEAALSELCEDIHRLAPSAEPRAGGEIFLGSPPASVASPRVPSATGRLSQGGSVVEGSWFSEQRMTAERGLTAQTLTGSMEISFGLHDETNKSQIELLEGVRAAQIQTFGWPIALLAEGTPDYAPKPYADGIRAELAVPRDQGGVSYDYWAAKNNGDFCLLESLFEDRFPGPAAIFFNTRIVRVTEALMFADRCYRHLGVSGEVSATFRVAHKGLVSRRLKGIGNRTLIREPVCHASESMSDRIIRIGTINADLVDHVEALLAPLFVLFEFQRFARPIYEDIVRRFEKGETS